MSPCRDIGAAPPRSLTVAPRTVRMPVVLSADRPTTSAATALLVLGGLTWLPARWGVMTTWNGTWLGLDYAGWNRAMLVPLALLTAGTVLAGRRQRRAIAISWWAAATGFALSWLGVALEFVLGGGLQGGPRDVAVAGWTIYLLGTAVTAFAALGLAAVLARTDRAAAAAAGLAGAAILVWPVLLAAGLEAAAVVDQLVVGVLWAVVGVRPALRPAPRVSPVRVPS